MAQNEKYRVIRKIASGGMAEVFLGEAEGIQGFTKKVAIKRVLPHLVQNQKFLAMFLDEARLSLRLNHANVVQVFDIGRSGGTYFIVMEFVDGTNVKQIMEYLRRSGSRLPIAQSVFIVMEVCRGLSYAHDLPDASGRNLGLVHRDVSPPNILVSKQGEVKLVDFGLAKATSQLEHTDPGVVKGKFAYLSPEAAWGREVDRRADIFALGIVLWELLTGRRLFLGENDVQTVELVRMCDVPPIGRFNPEVADDLEKIVGKCLSQDARQRYQTSDQMGEDLAGFLFSHGLKVTGYDLRRMVASIAEEEDEGLRPSIIDQLIQEEVQRFSSLDDAEPLRIAGGKHAEPTGAQPLDPTGFEDPRGWVGELEIDGLDRPLPEDQADGWREGGRRDSSISGERMSDLELSLERPEVSSPSLAQMLEGDVRLSADEEESVTGKTVLVGAAVAVGILAACAVLALVLGWIP